MSLSTIPPELGGEIARFMDHDALNNLSKVSKYYRSIAEPFLYRNLEFRGRQDTNIRWLFLTIVSRPGLAAHIRSFKLILRWSQAKGKATTVDLNESFCKLYKQLKGVLLEILGANAPPEMTSTWVCEIARPDGLEGCLAYILFRAVSILSIDLGEPILPKFGPLLAQIAYYACQKGIFKASVPFSRLKNFRGPFPGVRNIPHLPSLDFLEITHWSWKLQDTLNRAPDIRTLDTAGGTKIQSLKLQFVDIQISTLCKLLQHERLRHLTVFSMINMYDLGNDISQSIITTLQDHCPYLTTLEWLCWAEEFGEGNSEPVQGLQELHSLTILLIDLSFMVNHPPRTSDFLNLTRILPPNLESLNLASVPCWNFVDWVEPYANNAVSTKHAMQHMRYLKAYIPLRKFSISLDPVLEGDRALWMQRFSGIRHFLITMARSFLAMGIKLSILEEVLGSYSELRSELLVDAESTADDEIH
ncbi:uncharacterized protein K460DRAFT_409681 [Cucurbitaria berberidis CBS 394.84]|uniref:F-box domain-containing protein n=1 Tax=Cucurbitaria berberidis CBS 394.84 TaxID=1168544 RepID=A0A9P4GAZ1_9PLEO|nr:uncharacterized protein K460DRAFT_409681 [Cucurbitaria berberidis CBS 394.84]KAF1842265.1 hypothetical protein K460DRAFT_409681 [Cucurbitaria berberidis CBS 394.84]